MRLRMVCLFGIGLFLFPLIAMAQPQTSSSAWKVASPYPNNPLKTATLDGTAMFKGTRGQAWLTIACRPDEGEASIMLKVDKALAGSFSVDAFEGPGGVGESRRLVRVKFTGSGEAPALNASGAFQEGETFEWTIMPRAGDIRRWVEARGSKVIVTVQQPGKKGAPLKAVFMLPASDQGLREVVEPCMKKK